MRWLEELLDEYWRRFTGKPGIRHIGLAGKGIKNGLKTAWNRLSCLSKKKFSGGGGGSSEHIDEERSLPTSSIHGHKNDKPGPLSTLR